MPALAARHAAMCGWAAGLSGAASGMRLFRRGTRSESGKRTRAGSHLEQLALTAQEVFQQGKQATPDEVARLQQLMAAVPLAEVGLEQQAATADFQPADGGGASKGGLLKRLSLRSSAKDAGQSALITYLHICETPAFALGIFCLPTGTQLPLHDHPQMTVFSRVMYGRLQVEAYDWETPAPGALRMGESRPARPALSQQLGPEDPPVVLFPSRGGNIHSFSAVSSCAVLDLLAPPYDLDLADRSCSYYAVDQSAGGLKLKRVPSPRPYNITNGEYTGISLQ